jgi:hypothetical protein
VRRQTAGIALVLVGTVVVFGGAAAFYHWKYEVIPLGRPAPIKQSTQSISPSAELDFLASEFRVVTDMRALPAPVIKALTEEGGTRLTIANPAERFEATDVIIDESIPRKRLLFAGVSENKSFVLYEQGGIGTFYVLALFQLNPENTTPAIWTIYCAPAASIAGLRTLISQGQCSRPDTRESL